MKKVLILCLLAGSLLVAKEITLEDEINNIRILKIAFNKMLEENVEQNKILKELDNKIKSLEQKVEKINIKNEQKISEVKTISNVSTSKIEPIVLEENNEIIYENEVDNVNKPKVKILTKVLSVRERPNTNSKIIGYVYEGQRWDVVDFEQNRYGNIWYKIKYQFGEYYISSHEKLTQLM